MQPAVLNARGWWVPVAALAILGASLPAHAGVEVADAWVRGTIAGQDSTGAYMKLRSDTDAALTGALSSVAGHTQLHQMMMHGQMMMMMPLDKLALPAGRWVSLDESNYHIMLEELRRPLKEGDSVELTLEVTDAAGKPQKIKVQAVVRPLTATGGTMDGMHHHDSAH